MAQQLDEILNQLSSVYQPQTQAVQQQQQQGQQMYNSQMAALPAQYQAQQAGLDATKNQAFQSINDGANARGMLYSGAPIAEQQKYLGASYLPAVAKLQGDQLAQQSQLTNNWNDHNFKLSSALSDITKNQYNDAYGIQQKQAALDAANRQTSMLASLYGNQGGQQGAQQQEAPTRSPIDIVSNVIHSFRSNPGAMQGGWGGAANYLKQNGIDTSRGSAGDIALNRYFNAGGMKDYAQSIQREQVNNPYAKYLQGV